MTRASRRLLHRLLLTILAALVLSYVGAFVGLSRSGMRRAARVHSEGYFFVELSTTEAFVQHTILRWAFSPLVVVDTHILGNPPPGKSEPLRDIE